MYCYPQDNLLLINDAYQVIMAIVSTQKGRQAFISNRDLSYMITAKRLYDMVIVAMVATITLLFVKKTAMNISINVRLKNS